MRRQMTFMLAAVVGFTMIWTARVGADEPVLDPSEPPVRLKKKNRPPRDKKGPAAKDGLKKDDDEKPALRDPDEAVRPKVEDQSKKPPVDSASPEDERTKIVDRILKNLEKVDQKLARNDPGKATRAIQREILEDLDKLIEETRNQPPSSGKTSKSRRKNQKRAPSGEPGSSNKKNGRATHNNPREAKKKSSGPKNGLDKKDQPGAAGGKSSPRERSKLNDLFKDVWGHLPETMRLEMDAYSRARFLPEYDMALKQYYRTLSEQGRKK